MEVINTPLELITKEELKRRIREGMILKDQLMKANKTLEEYKEKYADVVPSSILEERNALEEELEQANTTLAEKEEELAKWELLSRRVMVINDCTFNAGQPYGTLYNIFVYEYSIFLMNDAPLDIWSEKISSSTWMDFWRNLSPSNQGLISVAWMLGWEEVKRDQVAIVLGGSPPLRALACLIDLILRHQLDIQLYPVGTLTPYLIFKNQYFGGVPQGAEIPPKVHIDKLQHCFRLLFVERVKQALDILNSSPSNRMFGGANLMIATSRSLAHGLLLIEKKTYAPFNPIDFSLPPSYSTEERIEAEKVFDC